MKSTDKNKAAENVNEESPEQRGKKEIKADKEINKRDKSAQQKNDEEKKDAAQWRNEG